MTPGTRGEARWRLEVAACSGVLIQALACCAIILAAALSCPEVLAP